MPLQPQKITFDAKTTTTGIHDVFVTATADTTSLSTRTKYTVIDRPKIEINNLTFPKEVTFTQKKRMRFTLAKKSWAQPRNVLVSIQSARQTQNVRFDSVEGDVPFIFVVEGKQLNTGSNNIEITINYEDDFGNKYSTNGEGRTSLVNTTLPQKISIFFRNAKETVSRIRLF